MEDFFRRFLICGCLFFQVFHYSLAGSSPVFKEWQHTQDFYELGKWNEALQTLIEHPRDDSNYHYNLGTIYFRLGQFGRAVAHLEKANYLHPQDFDIQFNLNLARSALARSIGTDQLDQASSWIEQIADRISLDEVRAILGLLGTIVALLWIRAYLKTRNLKEAVTRPAGLLGIFGFGITLSLYGVQRHVSKNVPAISLQKQVVRSGPGEHFIELKRLEAGLKVRMLGPSIEAENSVWKRIRFSSDGIGWVRANQLLAL